MALFWACNRLALQGFGGVLPLAQRELVERHRWVSRERFLELLSLSQVLPGPNIINLLIMLGYQWFGWRGALAAVGGVLLAPLVLVLGLAVLAAHWRDQPMVAGGLRGMGVVAAALVLSTAAKLAPGLRGNPMGLVACIALCRAHGAGHRLAALAAGVGGARPGPAGLRAGLVAAGEVMNAWLFGTLGLTPADWLALFGHFMVLSLLAVGGAITTAPDMHRYIVGQRGWLDDAQFTASVALAQAAPGPNVLFVAVIGFNVGGLIGHAGHFAGHPAAFYRAGPDRGPAGPGHAPTPRWHRLHRRAGAADDGPAAVHRLDPAGPLRNRPAAWLLVVLTLLVMLRTKASPLWLIALGAVAGAAGWV
jgi:chromate transporter